MSATVLDPADADRTFGKGNRKRSPRVLPEPRSKSEREIVQIIPGRIYAAVEHTLAELGKADCGIYARGSTLVRPVVAQRAGQTLTLKSENDTVVRPDGALVLAPLSPAALSEVMSRHVEYQKEDGRSKYPRTIDAPSEVARTIIDRQGLGWPFPRLRAVVRVPPLRQDGSVAISAGFDEASGLLFVSDRRWRRMDNVLDITTAKAAVRKLFAPIKDFPFVDASDRAAALALLITAVIRPSLDRSPMFCVSAPAAGSGKSLIVDMAAILATGCPACVITPTPDEAELEKRLGASALAGDAVMSIDNVTHPLRSDQLCQLLTQEETSVRILGRSENVRIASTALVCCTGNNLALHGDLNRRSIRVRLDAKSERPDERSFTENPLEMVTRNRPALVEAALDIVRAYQRAGRPSLAPAMGSFETWSGIVRSALIWTGEADCRDNADEFRAEDPELQLLAEIITALPKGEWTVKDLRRRVHDDSDLRAALADFLDRTGGLSAAKLGGWLRRFKDRPVSGKAIRQVSSDHAHGSRWAVL